MYQRTVTHEDKTARAFMFENTTELAERFRHKSKQSTFKGVTRGDTSRVQRSDKVLDRIETIERLADAKPASVRQVCGGVADVPAYLSGSPLNMRMRRREEAKRPLTIVVDTCSSWGCSAATMERRGVATLALLRKLEAEGYPVQLWAGAGLGTDSGRQTSFVAARMDTGPIDLARASWQLCHEDMLRDLFFKAGWELINTSNEHISWPFDMYERYTSNLELQAECWAQCLDTEAASVLVVPPMFLSEAERFKTDELAAQWVNEKYRAITELSDDA